MATTYGVLGAVSRRYAHRIPFIVKMNHNELLTFPNKFDQIMFGSVEQAFDLGAAGVGATIYFGSDEATRQIQEVAESFARAHELGMFTVLWCYLRNSEFKQGDIDYHNSADLTAQANHIGVTIEADIIKQKLPTNNGGYNAFKGYGKTNPAVYDSLTSDHPIDLCRWQVANCYMGRIGLINSGGESKGASDLAEAVRTAVVNKRAGGIGLISGRKAFQRPMSEGVELLNAIQDVYLDEAITIVARTQHGVVRAVGCQGRSFVGTATTIVARFASSFCSSVAVGSAALPVTARDAHALSERIHGGSPAGRSASGMGARSASSSCVP